MRPDGLITLLHENVSRLEKDTQALAEAIQDNDLDQLFVTLPKIRKTLNSASTTFSVLELRFDFDDSAITTARALFRPASEKAQFHIGQAVMIRRRRNLVATAIARKGRQGHPE